MKTIAVRQNSQSFTISSIGPTYIAPVLLAVVDYAMVVLAFLSAWYIRALLLPVYFQKLPPFHINDSFTYYVVPLIYFAFLAYSGLYSKRLPFWKNAEILFRVCIFVNVLAIVFMYFTGKAGDISRLFIVISGILSFCYLLLGRHFTKKLLIAGSLWQKPVVIVGAGKTAEILAKTFMDEPGIGYKIVGLVEDCYTDKPMLNRYPHLGCFSNAEEAVIKSGVQDVIIAAPGLERKELLDIVYRVQPHVRSLTIVPDLFGMPLSNMEAETLFNEKTIMLKIRNNMMLARNRFFKRTFDLVCSICGVIAISPLLLAIAIAIYVSNPGPIFFAHKRIGVNGKKFPCYKFRSMVMDAETALGKYLMENPKARAEWEKDFKLKDDPRITSIGKFLRKTSLDELPQLFNVMKGEMSLVGPRPIIDKEIIKYGDYINDYYLVRPGITGYWQVSGRNDVDYDSRVQMDSWYVRNWSLWQDIVLLLKTVKVVFTRKGAY